jgi:hypothetical protein
MQAAAQDGSSSVGRNTGVSWRPTDNVGRQLEELCRPGVLERRQREGERHLLGYVDAEARNLSSEAFAKLIESIFRRVDALLRRESVQKGFFCMLSTLTCMPAYRS